MPLFKGRQNIGRNIKTERMAGKSMGQAKAIGISAAIGGKTKAKLAMNKIVKRRTSKRFTAPQPGLKKIW